MYTPFIIRFLLSTFTLSLFIIGILFVKRVLKRHISIQFQYKIWYLLLVLLVVPFIPNELFNWGNMYNRFGEFMSDTNLLPELFTQNMNVDHHIANSNWLQDFTISVNRFTHETWINLLLGIWIAGIGMMVLFTLLSNIRIVRIIKSAQFLQDSEIMQVFDQCKAELHIKRKLVLRTSSWLKSPVLFGVFRPRIILPEQMISKLSISDIRYIILHELCHYKRKDLFINYVMCLLQILYWFNPLVWLAFKEMRLEREIACDHTVLELLNEDQYTDYGNTIIQFADLTLKSAHLNLVADMGGAKQQITKRIQQIASFKGESKALKVKSIVIFVLIGCLLLAYAPIVSVKAQDFERYHFTNKRTVSEDLSDYFKGYDGSFVLYDSKADQYTIYNEKQSTHRISPVSTYKIYSLLLGLESNIISREDSVIEWDGTKYPYDSWNMDQDLFSGMKNSVNWYFQELDKRVGTSKLEEFYKQLGYGNHDLSGGLSDYWLESSLKISPIEQVQLLEALNTNQFQFKASNIQTVKDALRISLQESVVLSGKTGTGAINGKDVNGWFIGFVEANDNTYYFATNIQNEDNSNGSTAAKITLSILEDKHLLDKDKAL